MISIDTISSSGRPQRPVEVGFSVSWLRIPRPSSGPFYVLYRCVINFRRRPYWSRDHLWVVDGMVWQCWWTVMVLYIWQYECSSPSISSLSHILFPPNRFESEFVQVSRVHSLCLSFLVTGTVRSTVRLDGGRSRNLIVELPHRLRSQVLYWGDILPS